MFQGDIKVKDFAFSNAFADGKSLQNLFIGFGPAEAVFVTKMNNFPEAIIGRIGGYITARVQKSRNKTWRCKTILSASFDSWNVIIEGYTYAWTCKGCCRSTVTNFKRFANSSAEIINIFFNDFIYLPEDRYKVKSKVSGLIDFLLLYPLVEGIRCLRHQLLRYIRRGELQLESLTYGGEKRHTKKILMVNQSVKLPFKSL